MIINLYKKNEFEFWPYFGLIVFVYHEIAHIVWKFKILTHNSMQWKSDLVHIPVSLHAHWASG